MARRGDLFIASVIYFLVVLEVLTGDLPSKHAASKPEGSTVFFWIMISVEFAICMYFLVRGVYERHKLRSIGQPVKMGLIFTPRAANLVTAVSVIFLGLSLIAFALAEINDGAALGGAVFKNRKWAAEPEMFRWIVTLHLTVGIVPAIGGVLMLIFRPPAVTITPGQNADDTRPQKPSDRPSI